MTTNLKSINNQNHQKIKVHGTLTTKELKKNQNNQTRKSGDPVGGLRRTVAMQQTVEVGLAAELCGLRGQD